jgi:hypothetical protein
MLNAFPVPHISFEPVARWVTITALIGLAAYHFLLTVFTVLAFGLRYPFMDQFRLNLRYLTTPFPQNVLTLENGHRPVLPGLVRLVELNWLAGTQVLQSLTAWLAAGVIATILLFAIARDLRRNSLLWASAGCVLFTMLAWNANARMFIHAYEAVHVFYVVLFVVIAIDFTLRGTAKSGSNAWIISIAACLAATFSFGPGIASFAAIMTVAILRRCKPGTLLFIAFSACSTFLLYYFVLPGAEGVQGGIAGFSFRATVFFSIARIGAVFAELVRLYAPDLEMQATVAASAGLVGIAVFLSSLVKRWSRREHFVGTELFGTGLVAFGLATNTLIATTRTSYFFEHPDQLFADRYLFWSCVTWLGILLYGLQRLDQASRPKQYAAATAVVLLSLSAIPPALWVKQWSAEVFRLSELAAIAMKLGIRNDAQVAEISDGDLATIYRALDEMKSRNLAMFADPTPLRLGNKVTVTQPQVTVATRVMRVDTGRAVATPIRMLSGELPPSLVLHEDRAELWFASHDGTLIGRACLTNSDAQPKNIFRLGIAVPGGFQGYVVQSDKPEILLARERNGVVKPLAHLELRE